MSTHLTSSSGRIVLVAIPDEWRTQVQQMLEQNGYLAVMATSQEEAGAILQKGHLDGAVLISDWAMTDDSGKAGLLQLARDRIPTVCLVRKGSKEQWFEEVYHPPLHEYCSIPFDEAELRARLGAVISKTGEQKQ